MAINIEKKTKNSPFIKNLILVFSQSKRFLSTLTLIKEAKVEHFLNFKRKLASFEKLSKKSGAMECTEESSKVLHRFSANSWPGVEHESES